MTPPALPRGPAAAPAREAQRVLDLRNELVRVAQHEQHERLFTGDEFARYGEHVSQAIEGLDRAYVRVAATERAAPAAAHDADCRGAATPPDESCCDREHARWLAEPAAPAVPARRPGWTDGKMSAVDLATALLMLSRRCRASHPTLARCLEAHADRVNEIEAKRIRDAYTVAAALVDAADGKPDGWRTPDQYEAVLHACGNCDTPLYCQAGEAVCRRWLMRATEGGR